MIVVSRKEARERGLTRYYTGVPCLHGHTEGRLVSNKKCVACARAVVRARQRSFNDKGVYVARKLDAIAYKGGKCEDCGWAGHHSGFEFDHPKGRGGGPKYKKSIAYHLIRNSWPRICEELDSVDIVCAVCHNFRTWSRHNGVD